jgi:hypothetical protein
VASKARTASPQAAEMMTSARPRWPYLSKSRGHRIISFQTTGYEVGGQRILVRSVQPRPASPEELPATTPSAVTAESNTRPVLDK